DRRHPGARGGHQSSSRHRPQPVPVSPTSPGLGLRSPGGAQGDFRPGRNPQPGKTRAAVTFRPLTLVMSGRGGSVLVVDVGTSGVRAAVVRPDASVEHAHYAPVLPDSPAPGLVEFDAARMADAVLDVARAALADGGRVEAGAIANQRASTIVWERAT